LFVLIDCSVLYRFFAIGPRSDDTLEMYYVTLAKTVVLEKKGSQHAKTWKMLSPSPLGLYNLAYGKKAVTSLTWTKTFDKKIMFQSNVLLSYASH